MQRTSWKVRRLFAAAPCLWIAAAMFPATSYATDYPSSPSHLCASGGGDGTLVTPGGSKVKYCSSRGLDRTSTAVRRAVIVITGSKSNPKDYFSDVLRLGYEEDVMGSTDIIVPAFLEDDDVTPRPMAALGLDSSYLYWSGGWRFGNSAKNGDHTSSYAVIDLLVGKLIQTRPNLEHIAIVGHSAGGQFAHRYAAGNEADEYASLFDVTMSYGASAAGSFMWLDSTRPRTVESGCTSSYDDYAYGLLHRNGRMNDWTPEVLRNRLLSRHVYYFVGNDDRDDATTCEVRAQGLDHVDRLRNYRAHLQAKCINTFGALCELMFVLNPRAFTFIPDAPHNHDDTFGSTAGRNILFYWE